MANICDFSMLVKGDKKGINKFFNALTQNGNVWMGRGAEADIYFKNDNEAYINGWCKWSIVSALIDNAKSMRRQKETGEGCWGDLIDGNDYITLFEACKEYHVNMEVYSEESGMGFQEHFIYENGEWYEDCVNYEEYYYDENEFDSFDDFLQEYGLYGYTENDLDDCDCIKIGGFDSWEFDLADVKED